MNNIFFVQLFIVTIAYLLCYYIATSGKHFKLLLFTTLFSFSFLFFVFGGYFLSIKSPVDINFTLLGLSEGYFFLFFLLFSFLYKYGVWGAICHSLCMSVVVLIDLVPPLNPLILYYAKFYYILPRTHSPLCNLWVLYFLPALVFCRAHKSHKITSISIIAIGVFFFSSGVNKQNPIKVAVIQVGLYLDLKGSIDNFYKDLSQFLILHPDVDIVAFSENNVFSFKSGYNKDLAIKLLNTLLYNKFNERHHLLLSLNGYNDINNVVTLYKHGNSEIVNQKKILIPFIERKGLLNKKTELNSEYFWIDKNIENTDLKINEHIVNSAICFDSLFPSLWTSQHKLTIVQSNYNVLNHGDGFNRLLIIGAVLSKFSVGLFSDALINIQNTGGTVAMNRTWDIDDSLFLESKRNPFLIVSL